MPVCIWAHDSCVYKYYMFQGPCLVIKTFNLCNITMPEIVPDHAGSEKTKGPEGELSTPSLEASSDGEELKTSTVT